MPSERSADVKFEIGHVLFIDIVGYSKLLINEQSEQIQKLKEIVRGTEQVRLAEAEGKLVRLPTGDGGALVFRNSPEAPVLCALEISEELKKYPELRVRMGIHSGPVNEITDLNEQANIAGAGINTAQRVMDCGDTGHILLSKRVADDLEQYPQWRALLHDLGDCEVKHGARLQIVNLYTDEVGNAAVPARFETKKTSRLSGKRPSIFQIALIVSILLLCLGIPALVFTPAILKSHRSTPKTGTVAPALAGSAIPEKSIAVLPFENLSEEKTNAYFAEGIQDEILTRLAKIADLKVISRTSTQKYKSAPDNLREIAQQLGVATILEGSVQKAGDEVRITVQLIRALSDSHLWAETYDRKLLDTFGVESEVAQKIASSLKAKLTGFEQRAIAAQPTANPEAYQLYLKGRFFWNKRTGEDLKTALDYFQKAVAADPNYANAYAGEADACLLIPLFSAGTPKEYFPKAKAAAQHAIELDETSAEGHAALGQLLSFDLDFTGSEKEFQRAIELNPNYATAHHWYGNTFLANVGRFDEAIAEGKRAVELDPLSLIINADLGSTLMWARRFDEAIAQQRRTLALDGNFYYAHWNLGEALYYKGDVAGAIAEYEKARSLEEDPETLGLLGQAYAKTGRKEEALKILAELNEVARRDYVRPELFAIIYIGLGDKSKAIQYLEDEYQRHDGFDFVGIRVDPRLDPLRDHPRFKQLLAKVIPR
jgi:TolB-like protein/Tfp pilus assembly protein PilF/class 3 adenylate cyclase